jgi:hypothetical protein
MLERQFLEHKYKYVLHAWAYSFLAEIYMFFKAKALTSSLRINILARVTVDGALHSGFFLYRFYSAR